MDITTVTIIAAACVTLGVIVGRITKQSSSFDPFTYYRARVRQIVDSADKQPDLQEALRELDKAFTTLFPDTKK